MKPAAWQKASKASTIHWGLIERDGRPRTEWYWSKADAEFYAGRSGCSVARVRVTVERIGGKR